MGKRTWTDSDVEFLMQRVGSMGFGTIAKRLGKTETAVIVKAKRLKLGCYKGNTEHLTVIDAAEYLNIDRGMIYYYIKKGRLKPIVKTVRGRTRRKFLSWDEILRFEKEYSKQHCKRWSVYEISVLKALVADGFTNRQIAERLGRTESSVESERTKVMGGEHEKRNCE